MALPIKITATSGGGNTRFYATLKRRDTGHRWSVAASAWEASPTYSNSKIALSEGASEYLGSYSASVSGLGSPDVIDIFIHDASDSDKVIAQFPTRVMGGNEVPFQLPSDGLNLISAGAGTTVIATAVLTSAASSWEDSADVYSLGAMVLASFNASRSEDGTELLVNKSDDSEFHTYTVTVDAGQVQVLSITQ